MRIFCPRCEDVFWPQSRHKYIDGAFFGTTFPHLLLLTYPQLRPDRHAPAQKYTPKVFGFKIHP